MNRLKEVEDVISRHSTFLIGSHRSPEADAIGSQLGLSRALRQRGKKTVLINVDGVPKDLAFLKGSDSIRKPENVDKDELSGVEVGIAVDCSNLDRLGDQGKNSFRGLPIINIDHHQDNSNFGDVNYVKPVAATTEIISDLLDYMGLNIDAPLATALYAGIIADTSAFRNDNVNATLMERSAKLLKAGADARSVIINLYESEPFSKLKLLGEVLSNAEFEEGIVWTKISPELLKKANATPGDTEGIVGTLRTTNNAKVACVMKELPDSRVKVSLRSKNDIDVSKVAGKFGGGGHRVAAGCLVNGDLDSVEKKILDELKQHLNE